MITTNNLKDIFNTLIGDETFCRLTAYESDPMGIDKSDIVNSVGHRDLMKDIIRFSPQIDDLEDIDRARVCLYKGYTKIRGISSVVRQEAIIMDLYVPHRLVREDFRIYQIENKVVALLDKMRIGIGCLDYSEGFFIQLPPISGYSQYKMTFVMVEGRSRLG